MLNTEILPLTKIAIDYFLGREGQGHNVTDQIIEQFVDAGLDYVFANTSIEDKTLCRFQKQVAGIRNGIAKDLGATLGAQVPIVVAQSSALALTDPRIAMSGHRADIDFLAYSADKNRIVRMVRDLGIERHVLAEDYSRLITLDDKDDIDFTTEKTLLGSFFIELDIESFSQEEKSLVDRIANRHLPVVRLENSEYGLLIGIDLIFSYSGYEIDISIKKRLENGMLVQDYEQNLVCLFLRLKEFTKLGYLKPNLLLVAIYLLTCNFDGQKFLYYSARYDIADYIKCFARYHEEIIRSITANFLLDSATACGSTGKKQIEEELSEIYLCLERYIENK